MRDGGGGGERWRKAKRRGRRERAQKEGDGQANERAGCLGRSGREMTGTEGAEERLGSARLRRARGCESARAHMGGGKTDPGRRRGCAWCVCV